MSEVQKNTALTSLQSNDSARLSVKQSDTSFASYLEKQQETQKSIDKKQVEDKVVEKSNTEKVAQNNVVKKDKNTKNDVSKTASKDSVSKKSDKTVTNDDEKKDAKNNDKVSKNDDKIVKNDKSENTIQKVPLASKNATKSTESKTEKTLSKKDKVVKNTVISQFAKVSESKLGQEKQAVQELNTGKGEKKSQGTKADNETIDDKTTEEQLALVGQSATKKLLSSADILIAKSDTDKSTKDSTKKSKKDDTLIKIIDERSPVFQSKNATTEKIVTSVKTDSNGNAQLTLNLTGQNAPQAVVATPDATTPNSFSQMLNENLQKNAQEFVKAGSIALKDNNKGTINLILHPDDLGNVKINLEISDNVLKGKIVVATKEAYKAFQDNLANLKQAFATNGFDSTSFDVMWSGSGADQSFSGGSNQSQSGKNPFARYYEDGLAELSDLDSFKTDLSYNNEDDRKYIDITA
jgi:flagellar hook-length control protein FliK